MAQQNLNVGSSPNAGDGEAVRVAAQKIQANFSELYAALLALGTASTKNTGTAAGNVPLLDGSGLLDTSVLPAIAITDTYVVASQAAMLALSAQKGDIAIRSDLNKSFSLATSSPTTLADWKELLTPTDVVLSVAGLTGAISAAALKTALGVVDAAAFAASKNGTDQTGVVGATATAITWPNEIYDVGGYFSANAWTPPAGKISLTLGALFGGSITVGALCLLDIYKNGVVWRRAFVNAQSTNSASGFLTADDQASGTDVYSAVAYISVNSGTGTVSGSTSATFFSGRRFAA